MAARQIGHAAEVAVPERPGFASSGYSRRKGQILVRLAQLDVTDPEPLPEGHPPWGLDNGIITSHDASPPKWNDPRWRRASRRTSVGTSGTSLYSASWTDSWATKEVAFPYG